MEVTYLLVSSWTFVRRSRWKEVSSRKKKEHKANDSHPTGREPLLDRSVASHTVEGRQTDVQ